MWWWMMEAKGCWKKWLWAIEVPSQHLSWHKVHKVAKNLSQNSVFRGQILMRDLPTVKHYINTAQSDVRPLSWVELRCNWLLVSQSVSQSVLASSPSVTLDQILAEVRQLRGWCHGESFQIGRWVCFLCSTLYWSLIHLTPSGVFFTWPSLESSSLSQWESIWVTCNWQTVSQSNHYNYITLVTRM